MPKVRRKRRFILGVTGGIASGKTTVMRLLAKSGIQTISADDLAHDCIRKGTAVYRAILARFGQKILATNQQIDRKKLGEIVFRDPARRRQLEKIVHPCVAKGLKQFTQKHSGVIALDIPLLFEAGYETWMDSIVVVFATQSQQLNRLIRRNALSRQEAKQRLASQMALKEKCVMATRVLDNSRTPQFLRTQVRRLLKELKRT